MGLNLNLCSILGLPENCACPKCNESVYLWFDDFDIKGGSGNPEPGVFCIETQCEHCNNTIIFKIKANWKIHIHSCGKNIFSKEEIKKIKNESF